MEGVVVIVMEGIMRKWNKVYRRDLDNSVLEEREKTKNKQK
jgi:hypothetical protein